MIIAAEALSEPDLGQVIEHLIAEQGDATILLKPPHPRESIIIDGP